MKKIAMAVSVFAFGLSLGIPAFAATPAAGPASTPNVAPAKSEPDNVQPAKGKVSKKTTHRKHAKKTQSPAPATAPAVN